MAFGAISGFLGGIGSKIKSGAKAYGSATKSYYTGADITKKEKEKGPQFKARKRKEVVGRYADTGMALGTAAAAILGKPKKQQISGPSKTSTGGFTPTKTTIQSAKATQTARINLGQSGPNLSTVIQRRQRGARGGSGGAGGLV